MVCASMVRNTVAVNIARGDTHKLGLNVLSAARHAGRTAFFGFPATARVGLMAMSKARAPASTMFLMESWSGASFWGLSHNARGSNRPPNSCVETPNKALGKSAVYAGRYPGKLSMETLWGIPSSTSLSRNGWTSFRAWSLFPPGRKRGERLNVSPE